MNPKRVKPRIKMSTEVASATILSQTESQSQPQPQTTPTTEGLSFEVRECEHDGDHVYTPGSPVSPASPLEYDGEVGVLQRSQSAAETDPVPIPVPIPAPETEAPKDANINRVQMGENPETIAFLHFLAEQGIDTTKFVTQHLMKYGSRVRIAQTDDGKIIGCLVFDNETDQSGLLGMSPEEAKSRVGPFIYMQMLIVAPEHATDVDKHWKQRLVGSFLECVSKNGKIAIVRADAHNLKEIEMYRSCGFYTMEDMGIPSYSSTKDNMEILAFTPMGLEGTTQIFKKFYDMGARF